MNDHTTGNRNGRIDPDEMTAAIAVATVEISKPDHVVAVDATEGGTYTDASGVTVTIGVDDSGRLVVIDAPPGSPAGGGDNGTGGGSNEPGATTAGRLLGTGQGYFGQLGTGTTDDTAVIVAAVTTGALAGKTVTALATGDYFSCALASSQVFCWGNNGSGQLGNGTTDDSLVPVAVTGALAGKTVTAISAGSGHACAIADGDAYCWGGNFWGQLGDGTNTARTTPTAMDDGTYNGATVTSIAAGPFATCLVAGGAPYCNGQAQFGQLGDGYGYSNWSVPFPVDMSGALAGKTVTSVAAGHWHMCAVASGEAFCWGRNIGGQIGDGTTTNRFGPVAVTGALAGKTVTSVTGGYTHSCAVANGAAFCWGENAYGQTGIGYAGAYMTPTAVDTNDALAGKTVTAISAGTEHTCAVASAKVYCWGRNIEGQLGLGTDRESVVELFPVAVINAANKTAVAVDASKYHTMLLYSN
jgi:alpha-tubulin suppressor-like RCC1 family protein